MELPLLLFFFSVFAKNPYIMYRYSPFLFSFFSLATRNENNNRSSITFSLSLSWTVFVFVLESLARLPVCRTNRKNFSFFIRFVFVLESLARLPVCRTNRKNFSFFVCFVFVLESLVRLRKSKQTSGTQAAHLEATVKWRTSWRRCKFYEGHLGGEALKVTEGHLVALQITSRTTWRKSVASYMKDILEVAGHIKDILEEKRCKSHQGYLWGEAYQVIRMSSWRRSVARYRRKSRSGRR